MSLKKKIGCIIIPNNIKAAVGRKEEVGNEYWVGAPAVSATARKKMSLNVADPRDRNVGRRRGQDPA